MRALLLMSLVLAVAAAPAAGQALRTVNNKKRGFKVKLPRFVKEVPTKPDEEQIIAKYKGTKKVRPASGRTITDRRTGKRVKVYPVELEIWVVRIANPKSAAGGKAVVTPRGGRRARPPRQRGGELADQVRQRKNSGRTIKEFLDRRIRGASVRMREVPQSPPWRSRGRKEISILKMSGKPSPVQTFMVEHTHEHFGHELFGLVFRSSRMDAFENLVRPSVVSLQRLAPTGRTYKKADPYADSELRHIDKRRKIRSRLVDGWYAEDTENFILITDMPSNSSNRQLLKDMLIDLETMRSEFAKRFPPVKPLDVVCTVRVCNSYAGYVRYSAKPGTGGYWHPIAEELVLFNPVGKIKKQAWMRMVTPKAILYHEAMHQYFHYANGEMPPASWFNEGYGEYYGAAKTDRYEKKIRTIGKNDFRWQVIKRAKKAKKWPKIKKILAMTQQQFYSRKSKDYPVLDNYAFGWAFCYFLEQERAKRKGERNEEWAAIPDRYLDNLRRATKEYAGKVLGLPKGGLIRFAIPVQKKAFEQTFKSTDFDALQAAWVAAMKSW